MLAGLVLWAAHAAGGVLLAGGMIWSARLRHCAACHHCGCPAHGD
jgi:hypothetical protein